MATLGVLLLLLRRNAHLEQDLDLRFRLFRYWDSLPDGHA